MVRTMKMNFRFVLLCLMAVSFTVLSCEPSQEGTGSVGTPELPGEESDDHEEEVPAESPVFTNPIARAADPWITRVGDSYWYCRVQGRNIKISQSRDLSRLGELRNIWTVPGNMDMVWAPELHHIGDRWYVYYAAGTTGTYLNQRTYVLRSKTDDPLGEWEDMGMLYTGDDYAEGIVPALENTVYSIDYTVFELNGQLYGVWSGEPDRLRDEDQSIYIATMSDPCTVSSNRVRLSRADRNWETVSPGVMINEGPAVLVRNGKVFIVYSANGSWTKHYCLGYIMMDASADPMLASNWTKSSESVFYRCDDTVSPIAGVNGVGHCCFTVSPDGTEDWIVYHAKNFNDDGYSGRSAFLKSFGWNEDGTPDFGTPATFGEALPRPSGEYPAI